MGTLASSGQLWPVEGWFADAGMPPEVHRPCWMHAIRKREGNNSMRLLLLQQGSLGSGLAISVDANLHGGVERVPGLVGIIIE